MARKQRSDRRGAWYHIGNGGVGDRTIFESRRDARYFLSLLARAIRRGWIELHAFVVMSNHFHLLLRSPKGMLSKAMQWIEQKYATYFNRTRCRTGAVFGKRFFSSEISSDAYWITVVRYIDLNPLRAKIATRPDSFPFGSARSFCSGHPPRWLSHHEIATFLGSGPEIEPDRYRRLWAGVDPAQISELVESRLQRVEQADDYLDQLLRGSDTEVLEWVRRLAMNADGIPPAVCLLPPTYTLEALRELENRICEIESGRGRFTTYDVLRVGVLRTACGESMRAIAVRLGLSYSTVTRLLQRHGRLLAEDTSYSRILSSFLKERVGLTFPLRRGESGESGSDPFDPGET